MVTGFVVAGAYAVGRLRGRWGRYERTALAIPLAVAALASPVQVVVGDWAAATVASSSRPSSPRSRASARRPTRRARPRPRLVRRDGEVATGSRSRELLSLLAFHDPNATVQGLDAVPPDDRPPVNVVRFAFQTMVGIGTLLALLGVCSSACAGGDGGCRESRWFYRALVLAGPLSVVALIAGWVRPRSAASRGSSTT